MQAGVKAFRIYAAPHAPSGTKGGSFEKSVGLWRVQALTTLMGPLGFAFLANALKAVFKGCTPTNIRDMDASWDCAGLYACCAQKPVTGHRIVIDGISERESLR